MRRSGGYFLLGLDVVDRVLHGADLLGVLVRDVQIEGLFKGHHQFDDVERVGARDRPRRKRCRPPGLRPRPSCSTMICFTFCLTDMSPPSCSQASRFYRAPERPRHPFGAFPFNRRSKCAGIVRLILPRSGTGAIAPTAADAFDEFSLHHDTGPPCDSGLMRWRLPVLVLAGGSLAADDRLLRALERLAERGLGVPADRARPPSRGDASATRPATGETPLSPAPGPGSTETGRVAIARDRLVVRLFATRRNGRHS